MALRVYKEGNKIIYSDDTFDKDLEDKASEVDVYPAPSTAVYDFVLIGKYIGEREIFIGEVQDKSGTLYTSQTWTEFYRANTGFSSTSGGSEVDVYQHNYALVLGNGNVDSTKKYILKENINFGNVPITVPSGGVSIGGTGTRTSGLNSSVDGVVLFIGENAGDVNLENFSIEVTGVGSAVYDLVASTGFEAVELSRINFNNLTSMGELDGYRQGLEENTGRFGGTPELTLSGTWLGGYRATTTNAFGMSNFTSLFKAGTGFTFAGRFITDMNVNLPAVGALIDFSPSNVVNDESLIVKGAFVLRSGVIDGSDSTLYPNINERSVKSKWSDNTGFPNTVKYLKARITTEVPTPIAAPNTYYPLLGTYEVDPNPSHISMPLNGEFELLSGNGVYQVNADYTTVGTAGNQLDIRVMKSLDGGLTWTEQVNHIGRQVNSFSGPRDVAFFPINFIVNWKKGERLRVETENKTSTGSVTAELDSYVIFAQV